VARGATARLYDVDHDQLKFVKKRLTKKYDQGTIAFRARQGRLVDLDKLHESLWATRLSGGTSSGVICLEVTVVGEVVRQDNQVLLKVLDSDKQFVLVTDVKAKPREPSASAFKELQQAIARGETSLRVTGYVDGWVGRWPDVLRRSPAPRPKLMVTGFSGGGK
jgi:hypothetical protein